MGRQDGKARLELALLNDLKRSGRQEEARPGSWVMDVRRLWSARARERFLGSEGWKDLVILFFSPRIRADISAALVDTEEN